jgi:hypothetical protein
MDHNHDTRTLAGIRHVLADCNKTKLEKAGELTPGTEVRVLRKDASGYYIPCLGYVNHVCESGRIALDLWADKSEQVTVSAKAVLWPALGRCGCLCRDMYGECEHTSREQTPLTPPQNVIK